MTVAKTRIVGELGGAALLLPDKIARGLAANSRIKFALSWLQAAETMARAGAPFPASDLDPERGLAGLKDDPLYDPPASAAVSGAVIEIVGAGPVLDRLGQDVSAMRAAIEAGADALQAETVPRFRQREEALLAQIRHDGDRLPATLISALARPPKDGVDTLHGLVMDMHKALNSLSAELAEEDIDGARVIHLSGDDKLRVASFMRGLNRTRPLKFDHPGLDANAMRADERLVIQNDIGTTDAHVLLIYVDGLRISVTYSDIHRQRLEFFERRLKDFTWTLSKTVATIRTVPPGSWNPGRTAAWIVGASAS